jgi:hypothetical protein
MTVLPRNDEGLELGRLGSRLWRRLLRENRHEGRQRTKELLHDRDYSGRHVIIGLMKLVSFLLAMGAITSARPYPAAERAHRVEGFRRILAATVESFQKSVARPDATPSVRDLTNAALGVAALERPAAEAESLMRMAFSLQDMTAGTVPWQMGHPEIRDANAIEFTCQAVGPLLLHYSSSLSNSFKEEMRPHIRAAFTAMRNHKVAVSYTNIFLMKTVNLILLGEATADAEAAADGYSMLDQWIEYTRRNGIHEFDSPTYYSVDLNSLNMGYRFAVRPEIRAKFKAVLDYFWTDIAANYFPGRQDLAGAHSRDYDFLGGSGRLLLHLHLEGLRDAPYTDKLDMETVYLLENEVAQGYRPAATILALAETPERVVVSRWDANPERVRYTYLTPDYAIGHANGDYNAQDKMVSIELASEKENFPAITIAPDTTDQPYGKLKTKDRSGHNKPKHLPLHPEAVQEKGLLRAVLNLDKSADLATHIVLPARADRIVLDGGIVKADQPFEKTGGPASVVGIREGNAAVAIRIFHADGDQPRFVLQADPEGLRWGAARYTVYHRWIDRRVRVGLLIAAARCVNDREFADLIRRVRDAQPALDIPGPPALPPVLSLNGQDLSLAAFLGKH